jgi:hypothetical protein
MSRTLARLLAVASILTLAAASRPARAQSPYISAYGACAPESSYVVWSTIDFTQSNPEWVGFDIMRRGLPGCDPYVRINPEIIPRIFDFGYTLGFAELSTGATAEYVVVPVDANRQPLNLGPQFCSPCNAFGNCPPLSGPITVGTLQELATGFVYVIPCPGTCYPSAFFSGGVPPELAPYVGTNATFSFFGSVSCGGVEGCYFTSLDHWVTASCVTPVATRSWGQLKTIYR